MAVQEISFTELSNWIREGRDFVLIDVRESHEHYTRNIGGELIPLSEINRRFRMPNPTKPVVFYCQKGIRSQIAIQRLHQKYPDSDFYNLKSGLASV